MFIFSYFYGRSSVQPRYLNLVLCRYKMLRLLLNINMIVLLLQWFQIGLIAAKHKTVHTMHIKTFLNYIV